MENKIVQDVVPPERKSIRNIPLPKHSTSSSVRNDPPPPQTPPHQKYSRSRFNKNFIIIGIIILALVGIFFGLSSFTSATVIITPKSQLITLNQTLTAIKEGEGASSTSTLTYQTISLSGETEKSVPATETSAVEEKASGVITIYNNYSSNKLLLVANTRFESQQGLIYRIKNPVTVPGQTTEGGKTVAGNVDVTVYADQAGDTYNSDMTDFTIPGLKGTSEYGAFSAKSKTALTGGIIGQEKSISTDKEVEIRKELQSELKTKLIEEAKSQVPQTFVFLENTASIEYKEIPDTSTSTDSTTAHITEGGTLYGVIIEKNMLARKLASNVLSTTDIQGISIQDYASLTITTATTSPKNTTEIEFNVKGKALFIWNVDKVLVKDSLKGTPRGDDSIKEALSKFPSILKATASIKPFWKRTFPSDESRITVDLTVDNME